LRFQKSSDGAIDSRTINRNVSDYASHTARAALRDGADRHLLRHGDRGGYNTQKEWSHI
jgi:hypothetical protein